MAEVIHHDVLGRPLKVGDPVAVPSSHTTLLIGTITAMGKKQIRVVKFGEMPYILYDDNSKSYQGKLRYPKEAVLLEGPDLTMYLMKWQREN